MSFDASSLQTFAMAASAAGSLASAGGSLTTGNANAQAAQYQAAVARNNEIVSNQNAEYAKQAGVSREQAQRQKTASTIGMQRAQMAKNGIDIGSGSALNLQSDTAMIGELDALTVRNNALRQAINFSRQGADFGANARLLDMQASNAKTAGNIGAFSSIVGGAGSVASKWSRWKTPSSGSNVDMWSVDGGV